MEKGLVRCELVVGELGFRERFMEQAVVELDGTGYG